jgi:hypothetical protein
MNTQKIHIINRIEDNNVGDLVCSPYIYYYNFFKDYNVLRHDLLHINWIEISKHDVVIVGGGGMFYVDFQDNLNKLLDVCPTVIVWGIGFNAHHDRPLDAQVDITRFKIIHIRDWMHPSGLAYLPCVSCLAVELDKVLETKRHIGIIEHKDFAIPADIHGERLNNKDNFQNITDLIASSEIVVANTYHVIYWAILMGKKVICVNPFSTRFDYFKYKPVFYSGDLEKDIAQTQVYPNALAEARELNAAFFEKVKKLIQELIPEKNKSYQYVYDTTIPALLRRKDEDIDNKSTLAISGLREEINRLHEEERAIHSRIEDEKRILHERINSLHREISGLHEEINRKTSLRHFAGNIKRFILKRLFNK